MFKRFRDSRRLKRQQEQALEWVNNVRQMEFDLPPLRHLPKGAIGSASECVIAHAFSELRTSDRYVGVADRLEVFKGDDNRLIDMPDTVMHFVNDFDNLAYPELVQQQPA